MTGMPLSHHSGYAREKDVTEDESAAGKAKDTGGEAA
jgi:hypothetical protein